MWFRGKDIGIDLGTATVLVYVRGKGIVLNEPSVVAIERTTNRVLAIGEEARKMIGRTPGHITAVRPLREGVIADFDITEKMLKHFILKVCGINPLFKPRVVVCVPSSITSVEKRAVEDAATNAGAKECYLIEEPVAAALGAGIDIWKPYGSMVLDIGGGTTDVAVLSLGGVVISDSVRIGGDKFDEAMVRYVKKRYNLLIGERTAEEIKINVGTVFPTGRNASMDVRGRDLVSGLPASITLTSLECLEAFAEPTNNIVALVRSVLERCPPELAADIVDKGIIMTGGGSLLDGLDRLIAEITQVPCNVADDPVSCVAHGTGKALENLDVLRGAVNASHRDARRY
ncbi:MAG: Rod shape-determining protein MreB [Firmicutes bacterium]|nr:Rod shape-determining protein MreB [candidate division NPL-UPA2 bacterium]